MPADPFKLQLTAPDLMMKLVLNIRYNLHILAVEIRHHDAVQTATAVARTWNPGFLYPNVDSLLPGNVSHN